MKYLLSLLLVLLSQVTYSQCWTKVSAGVTHTTAIKLDGTLWAWGVNTVGEIGDGSAITRETPVQISTDTDWVYISSLPYNSFGIKADGTLWGWGLNTSQALGPVGGGWHTPFQISADTNWLSVCGDEGVVMALKTDGTIWGWGTTSNGVFGDNSCCSHPNVPTQLTNDSDWKQLDMVYGDAVIAIKNNGTLWAWGNNINYELGDGTLIDHYVPMQVGTDTDWDKIAGGWTHALAIKTDKTLWAWGRSMYGSLGNGSNTDLPVPTQISATKDWDQIDAGIGASLALKTDGSLWGWGNNFYGVLGTSDNISYNVPTLISPDHYESLSLSRLGSFAGVISPDGKLFTWGINTYYTLGHGANVTTNVMTELLCDPNQGECWSEISSGNFFTLAIKRDGTLWGWGDNIHFQLGGSTNTSQINPVQIGTDTDWRDISAGSTHGLAIKNNGTLWAWGVLVYPYAQMPTQIGTDTDWQKIAAGFAHDLALKNDGTLWAWGDNSYGQIGNGSNVFVLQPTQVGTSNWKQISTKNSHNLAIRSDNTLWSWGLNNDGQLGINNQDDQNSPVQVGINATYSNVSAGYYHSLAIRNDGTMWAFGSNTYGQLGINSHTDKLVPTQVGGNFAKWLKASAGGFHSIVAKTYGELFVFGDNSNGQLGDGTTTERTAPVQIGMTTGWGEVAAGYYHSFVMRLERSIFGSGDNLHGQLGNNSTTEQDLFTELECSMLGTDEFESNTSNLIVYPNPTRGTITLFTNNIEIVSVELSDLNGRTVIKLKQNTNTLDLTPLQNGIYLIRVMTNMGIEIQKIIKAD